MRTGCGVSPPINHVPQQAVKVPRDGPITASVNTASVLTKHSAGLSMTFQRDQMPLMCSVTQWLSSDWPCICPT